MALADDLIVLTIEKFKQDIYPDIRAIVAELKAVAIDKDLCANRYLGADSQKTVGFMPRNIDNTTIAWLESQGIKADGVDNENGTMSVSRLSW